MNEEATRRDAEPARELALQRYLEAFDRGDLDALAEALAFAERDPELDRRITGVNAALHAEAGLQPAAEQAQTVRRLLLRHLPSGLERPAPVEAPLTVGDVAARLQAEEAAAGLALVTDREANRRLLTDATPVPQPLTERALMALVEQAGVGGSARYWELFRRAAIRLAVTRQRGQTELAAARRQTPRPHRSLPPRDDGEEDGR
jgi:hypothetical protein